MAINLNLTSFDKLIPMVGALAVAVCAAAGVDASRVVEVLVGLALVISPALVYYIKNKGLSYSVTSKLIASLPAAVAGVFLMFNIDVTAQLEAIGRDLLAILPVLVGSVGNSGAVLDGT